MRVIAGSARRLILKTVQGTDTRPTTDRIKETLFNILQPYVCDCTFLDLFSGSGGIGIEALSRGAAKAVLIDNNAKAVQCIRDNLVKTRLEDRAQVMCCDVLGALRRLEGKCEAFDLIFMDPPYHMGLERQVLGYLSSSGLADKHTTVIVEAAKETDFSWLWQEGWQLLRNKEYKTNKHVFVGRGEGK